MKWIVKRSTDKSNVFKFVIPLQLVREKGWENTIFVIIEDRYPKEVRIKAVEKMEDITWPLGAIKTDDY